VKEVETKKKLEKADEEKAKKMEAATAESAAGAAGAGPEETKAAGALVETGAAGKTLRRADSGVHSILLVF
jgi:hypothetical protein